MKLKLYPTHTNHGNRQNAWARNTLSLCTCVYVFVYGLAVCSVSKCWSVLMCLCECVRVCWIGVNFLSKNSSKLTHMYGFRFEVLCVPVQICCSYVCYKSKFCMQHQTMKRLAIDRITVAINLPIHGKWQFSFTSEINWKKNVIVLCVCFPSSEKERKTCFKHKSSIENSSFILNNFY